MKFVFDNSFFIGLSIGILPSIVISSYLFLKKTNIIFYYKKKPNPNKSIDELLNKLKKKDVEYTCFFDHK